MTISANLPLYVERGFDPVPRPPFQAGRSDLLMALVEADSRVTSALVNRAITEPSGGTFRYRAMANWVLLMFADLKEMGSAHRDDTLRGHVAENELSLWIPLLDGANRPAWYMPYVFNSEASAVITGREVYGYPKIHTPMVMDWPDGELPRSVSIDFPVRVGDRWGKRRLQVLTMNEDKVEQFQPASALPTVNAATEAGGRTSSPQSAQSDPKLRLRLRPAPPRGIPGKQPRPPAPAGPHDDWMWAADKLSAPGREAARDLLANAPLVFLKQFRDAERSDRACYQAIIHAKLVMSGRALRSVTPLGAESFSVKLPNSADFPLVQEVGLIEADMAAVPAPQRLPAVDVERKNFENEESVGLKVLGLFSLSTAFSIQSGHTYWSRWG
ncbi:MAG: hypothetical protein R2761_14115 [Acidimicrobiales bacterium]